MRPLFFVLSGWVVMEMAVQNRRRLVKKRLEPPATAHLLTFKNEQRCACGRTFVLYMGDVIILKLLQKE